MAITGDQVLTAFNAEQQGQRLEGPAASLSSLMRTPDFSSMDVSQDDYYAMDERGQAEAVARAVSARAPEASISLPEGLPTPTQDQPTSQPQEASQGVTEPSVGSTDDYIDFEVSEGQEYILGRMGIKTSKEPSSKTAKSDNLAKAATMHAYSNSQSIAQSLVDFYSNGAEGRSREAMEQASQEKAVTDAEDTREIVEDSVSPEMDNLANLDMIAAGNELIQKSQREQAAYFTNFVDSFAGPQVEQQVRDEMVANAAIYDAVQRTVSDMGMWEQTYEIFRSFVPGMDTKDSLNLMGLNFDNEEFARKFYYNFKELSLEDRLKAIPLIQSELEEIMPRGKASRILAALGSAGGELDIEDEADIIESLAFDAIDIIPIILGIGAAGYSSIRGLKAVAQAKKAEVADVLAVATVDSAASTPGTSLSTGVWRPAYERIRGLLPDGRRRIERGTTIDGEGEWVEDPIPEGPSGSAGPDDVASASERGFTSAGQGNSKARSASGLDEDSLAQTLSPFDSQWLDNEAINGMSNAVAQRLKAFELRNRELGRAIEEGRAFNRESFLTDSQIRYAERNIRLEYENTDGIENVITTRDGETINVEYQMADEDGNINSWRESVQLTLDDVQEMVLKDPGTIKRHMGGSLAWSHGGDFEEVVQSFIRQESGNARVLNQLRELQEEAYAAILGSGWKKIIKSLSPKQRRKIDRIDDILLSGDESQKVYTYDELRSGVAGHKLEEDEIETYYKLRTVLDNLFFLRNQEKRRELSLRGIKEVTLNRESDAIQLAKPLSDSAAAKHSVGSTDSTFFYDDAAKANRTFDEIDLTEEYANGRMLVRLDEAKALTGDANEVRYALVDMNSVSELPEVVLHRRVGYVPKVNNEGAYFAKLSTPRTVDGKTVPATEIGRSSLRTVRAFNNKKEADAWVEQQNMALRAQGIDVADQNYVRLEDRQLELERTASAIDSPTSVVGGGLYTGPRSSEEILWGAEGLKQPRANAFEATSRALTSVAKYVSTNQLRLGAQERALRTANMLRAKDGNPLNAPFNSFDELRNVAADTENNRKIKAMYDYIQDSLGFPTTEERLFQQSMQNIIDNSELARKMPGFRKSAFYLKSKDPIAAARSAAFHGLLGWFNPVQLWVQAQGAAVALSMNILNPMSMSRVLRNQFALQALQYTDNAGHVAKALGMQVDELTEMKRAFDKTGLKDSILTTADHAAAEAGYGVTMGAFRRAADKGLTFYRAGEMFNRRLSFATAFDEWRAVNKGAQVTDEALRVMLTRANNLMLNMNRANRASWQKGIWSLPFQFAQINARTVEAMLGLNGNFTWGERGKILAGQAALYGAAGIPLGNMGAHWLAESMGWTQEELEKNVDPGTIKAINEGFLGWLTLATFGVDVEIGERSSLIGGLQSFTSDLLFSEGTIADKLFGAFGNVGGRFWPALMGEYEPLSLGMAEGRVIDPVKALASPLIGSISTFRSIDKAFFMHNFHKIVDKNWNTVVNGPFTWKEELAAAAGFRLTDEVNVWNLRESNKAWKEYRAKIVGLAVQEYHKYALKSMHDQLSQDDIEEHRMNIALLVQQFDNPYERKLFREAVQQKLTNGQSALSKEWLEYRKLHANGEVDRLLDLKRALKTPGSQARSALSGGGLMQQGGFEGQEVIGNGE